MKPFLSASGQDGGAPTASAGAAGRSLGALFVRVIDEDVIMDEKGGKAGAGHRTLRVMDGRVHVVLLTLLDRPRSGCDCSPTRFRYAHYPRACKSRTSHQVKLRFGGGSPDEATVGGAWGASLGKWLRQRYCRLRPGSAGNSDSFLCPIQNARPTGISSLR